MGLKGLISEIKDNYVVKQVAKAVLPDFDDSEVKRIKITFAGKVQNVGFRLEIAELAKRLGLTGFAKNLADGKVAVEIQGPKAKIDYVVSFMEHLKRIKITDKVVCEIDIKEKETDFKQL